MEPLDEKLKQLGTRFIDAVLHEREARTARERATEHQRQAEVLVSQLAAELRKHVGENIPRRHILVAGQLVVVDLKNGVHVEDDVLVVR